MKYVKGAEVVEAVQNTKDLFNDDEGMKIFFCQGYSFEDDYSVVIYTDEGVISIAEGDYIIRNSEGKFYSCSPKTFDELYSPIVSNCDSRTTPMLVEEVNVCDCSDSGCEGQRYEIYFVCPNCEGEEDYKRQNYCPNCGQALKWESEKKIHDDFIKALKEGGGNI